MATQSDVRRIALSLPGTAESTDRFAFSVENKGKWKGFAWVWLERLEPTKPRVPNPGVLAVRVANLAQKDLLLSAETVKFFTEPHYNAYPAILVRLAKVSVAELRMLLEEAWRCQKPAERKKAVKRSANATAKPRTKSAATRSPAKGRAKPKAQRGEST